jgi:hypothetical protein
MVLILRGGRSVRYRSREPGEGKHVLYHNFSEIQKNKNFQIEKFSGSMRSIQKCIKTNQFPIGGSAGFFPKKCRQSVRLLLPSSLGIHHLPALICDFFGGKKNIKFLFPANTEENIARNNPFPPPEQKKIRRFCKKLPPVWYETSPILATY